MTDAGLRVVDHSNRTLQVGCHIVLALREMLAGELSYPGTITAMDNRGIIMTVTYWLESADYTLFVPWDMIKGALLLGTDNEIDLDDNRVHDWIEDVDKDRR